MQVENDQKQTANSHRRWSKRLWGALPTFFLLVLLAFVVILGDRIISEGKILKAEKASQLREESPRVNVVTLKLMPMPIRDRINLPGSVAPWVKLKVLAEINGKVIKKALKEGDTVSQGQIIAELDPRDGKNAYKSAKASYKLAVASLNRIKALYKKKVMTQSQMDDAVATVDNTKAAMDNAALALERCTIKAPISGIINRIYIEKGLYLNTADPVAEILQIKRVKVRVGIPESDVEAVRRLTKFKVKIDALGGKIFQARKHFLSHTADDMARLYNLDLLIENPSGEILPDMFARVEIVKKEVTNGLSVPLYAVISRNDEQIVYVVNEGKVHSRKVELGLQEGWRTEVKTGLKDGDQVVVVGQRSVNNGQPVNVIRTVLKPEDLVR